MIRIEGLSVRAGSFTLEPLTLEVPRGEHLVLLGPSGAGKSVFLEALAGLRPSSGRVHFEGREVTHEPPERRGVGYVVQGAALFPHLDAFENVAFPLRVRGIVKVDDPVKIALARVGAEGLFARKTGALSGGEAQRVALARALVAEPGVLLLDEPFAALDPTSRSDLVAAIAKAGVTTIHVDHDHEHAAAVASRIGILLEGRLVQVGAPDAVFRAPANEAVARFLRAGNLLEGEVVEDRGVATLRSGPLAIRVVTAKRGRARASVRPEDIIVSTEALRSSASNSLPGRVEALEERGPVVQVRVALEGAVLLALVLRGSRDALALGPGSRVWLTFKATAVHVF